MANYVLMENLIEVSAEKPSSALQAQAACDYVSSTIMMVTQWTHMVYVLVCVKYLVNDFHDFWYLIQKVMACLFSAEIFPARFLTDHSVFLVGVSD